VCYFSFQSEKASKFLQKQCNFLERITRKEALILLQQEASEGTSSAPEESWKEARESLKPPFTFRSHAAALTSPPRKTPPSVRVIIAASPAPSSISKGTVSIASAIQTSSQSFYAQTIAAPSKTPSRSPTQVPVTNTGRILQSLFSVCLLQLIIIMAD
jgi:hypothetical protein